MCVKQEQQPRRQVGVECLEAGDLHTANPPERKDLYHHHPPPTILNPPSSSSLKLPQKADNLSRDGLAHVSERGVLISLWVGDNLKLRQEVFSPPHVTL